MASRKLTPKQQAFLNAYLVEPNATAAYKVAGYRCRNDNVAAVEGKKLLRNPKIAAALQEARNTVAEAAGLTAKWVLDSLRAEAEDRGEHSSHSARVAALKLMGTHLGLFPAKVELGGKGGGPVAITLVEVVRPAAIADLSRQEAAP